MRFAAVARVTDGDWTACAVQDNLQFGLVAGSKLDVNTTLCVEARASRLPVVIDQASLDPVYAGHHTPRIYGIESYISVPIVRQDGRYFGNLCAIDPLPATVSDPKVVTMFERFAELISMQLDSEDHHEATERALQTERAHAELREHFIAVLGHDLRNPLSSIGMTGEILVRRKEPELHKLGDRLKSSTRRMSQMIDDLLDFARARLGATLTMQRRDEANLGALLEDVVSELRAANPTREIVSHIALSVPVQCDPGRLQRLLSNLLGNAIAYGATDAPIVVNVQMLDDAHFEIAVANHGDPIPGENLARVFEPYWRATSSRASSGLGLGLFICSQIAKAHGGTLSASSNAEEGTRFAARLPIQ